MMHDENFYGTSTVGSKGQIVIPIKARKSLDIKYGDEFIFFGHGKLIHLVQGRELNGILDKMTERFSLIKENIKKASKNDQ